MRRRLLQTILILVAAFGVESVEASIGSQCYRALTWIHSKIPVGRNVTIDTPLKARIGLKDSVVIVVVQAGKILYEKRKGSTGAGTWALLGGKREPGESIADTAKREFFEEAGVELKNLRWIETNFPYQKENETRYRNFVVLAEIASGEIQIMEKDKMERLEWFDFDKLPAPLFQPNKVYMDGLILALKKMDLR